MHIHTIGEERRGERETRGVRNSIDPVRSAPDRQQQTAEMRESSGLERERKEKLGGDMVGGGG
jgi:hypothetical protein